MKKEARLLIIECDNNTSPNDCNYCIIIVLRGLYFLEESRLCARDKLVYCLEGLRSLGESLKMTQSSYKLFLSLTGNQGREFIARNKLSLTSRGFDSQINNWVEFLRRLRLQIYKLCMNVKGHS